MGPRDPEIGHDGVAVLERDIRPLDVTMHNAVCMRMVQRARHVARDAQGIRYGEPLFACEPLAEGFPFINGIP